MTNADRSNEIIPICQICYKIGHTTDDCWHRYIKNYALQSRHFGRRRRSESTYIISFEPFAWYVIFAPYFNDSYIMNYSSYQLSNMNSMPCHTTNNLSTPEVAYLAKLEISTDEGWYLNNIATHHLTNNMANMNVKEEFNGSNELIIGNS